MLVVAVLGSIVAGIAAPTEAAAMGAIVLVRVPDVEGQVVVRVRVHLPLGDRMIDFRSNTFEVREAH